MDYEEKSGENLQERLEELRSELEEHKGFLQTYMLDPHPDFRPAEEERIKEISRLADELIEMLQDSREKDEEENLDDDLNLEYKTHTLGNPDDSEDADNIEGDWTIDEEEMRSISEADLPEAEKLISAKGKKGKKGKKKDKKDKKNKKKSKK